MITVRKIRKDDLQKIMEWRMRPDITKWMYTDPVLTMEKQLAWFEKISNDTTSKYWLIVIDGVDAGVISLTDISNGQATGGYYIAENSKRSLQNAISITLSLYKYCFEVLKLKRINNEMLAINKGVIRLNQLCGNIVEGTKKDAIEKNGQLYDVVSMYVDIESFQAVSNKVQYESINFEVD